MVEVMKSHDDMKQHVTECLEVLGVCFTRGNAALTAKKCARVERAKVDLQGQSQSVCGCSPEFLCPVHCGGQGHFLGGSCVPHQMIRFYHVSSSCDGLGMVTRSIVAPSEAYFNFRAHHGFEFHGWTGRCVCSAQRDKGFRSSAYRLATVWRYHSKGTKVLTDLGWEVQEPFVWTHGVLPLKCDLRQAGGMASEKISYVLRETWRQQTWMTFTQAARKDSEL